MKGLQILTKGNKVGTSATFHLLTELNNLGVHKSACCNLRGHSCENMQGNLRQAAICDSCQCHIML